jgi:uncharacterized protein (PEP-CTERM system associated)
MVQTPEHAGFRSEPLSDTSEAASVGAAFEIARLDNETQGIDQSRLTIDTARAVARVALQNQMILGAIAGMDHSDTTSNSHTDPLYGASVLWNPGPRTLLDATLEHRFFGLGGSLALRHRTPLMSFAVGIRRAPAMVTSTLGRVDARSDLRPLLDAILTSRYPDPTVRRSSLSRVWIRGRSTFVCRTQPAPWATTSNCRLM